jgi:hypothetical protein
MSDSGKRLRIRLPTSEGSITWRIRRSLRRLGRSLLQTLRPLCARGNPDVHSEEVQLPSSPARSELKNHSHDDEETLNTGLPDKTEIQVTKSDGKVVIDDVGTIEIDPPIEAKVSMNSICIGDQTLGT